MEGHGIQREDYSRAALAKSVELRALHAALLHGSASSSSSPSLLSRPPATQPSSSSHDYPIFTPSYEEQQLPGYHHFLPENHGLFGNSGNVSERLEEEAKDDEIIIPDSKSLDNFLKSQISNRVSYTNHFPVLPNASAANFVRASSRRTNSGDSKLLTTSNTCRPAMIRPEMGIDGEKVNYKLSVMTSSVAQPPPQLLKHRGGRFSWLFPKSKKKPKSAMSPNTVESDDVSQILKDWGVLSIGMMKKELLEANDKRDAALAEVTDMKSSLGELREKLVSLESYCEQLKKALKQAQGRDTSKRREPASGVKDSSSMPVSQEIMVEGFLQIVSEARLSVKQFCKTLINQTEDTDSDLMDKIDTLLQSHQINLSNKYSKGVLYHLEALINQSLYQDFENCVFQKNGCPKVLDPQQDRLENFSSFVSLRNLSWSEVLRKDTKFYNEDFSRFCDQKMGGIVSVLNWLRPWPEQLLHSFFVVAKCIWLLHLLAFSFSPPLTILRVEEDRGFDPLYMEDILLDGQKAQASAWVKVMVMPGFYIDGRVLRCRVLCRHHSVP